MLKIGDFLKFEDNIENRNVAGYLVDMPVIVLNPRYHSKYTTNNDVYYNVLYLKTLEMGAWLPRRFQKLD